MSTELEPLASPPPWPCVLAVQIETMSYIRHPNVVPFLGACLSLPPGASAGPGQANGPRDGPADGMRLMLISEYMTVRQLYGTCIAS